MDDEELAKDLRVFAVVAYGRTYGSRSRADLSKFIELSDEDVAFTSRLRATRNKYAAHSENQMTVTVPLLDLQRELDGSISIVQVSGITSDTPMPRPFIAEFAAMLQRLIDQLQSALQPLKDVVRAELTSEQLEAVFDDPKPLRFVVAPVAEWQPDGRRPGYPTSHLSTIHMDNGEQSGAMTASITR